MLGMWQFNERYLARPDVQAELWREPRWSARMACAKLLKWRAYGRGNSLWLRRWFGRGPQAAEAERRVRARMERLRG